MDVDKLKQIKDTALGEVNDAPDLDAVETLRIKYLGRKGLLQDVMKALKDVPDEQKAGFGQAANALKQEVQAALEERKQAVSGDSEQATADAFDFTMPGQWRGLGSAHPISQITDRVIDIFSAIGFTVAEGPDMEDVFHNFDALNTPPEHPSRDARDTFYLDNGKLLRTHTSPVQIRYMENNKPPVRILSPGRCYRRDTEDRTHSANFHQVEGLYVSERVSLADLKGDIAYFAREILGPEVQVRFRPHFFPFTEPSIEVDFSCHVCAGQTSSKGCATCRESGWIEIMGAGMVDPEVFKAVGYNPEEVTGYAFGMGIERIAMVMLDIDDIRRLYQNDVRFLKQF
jgi:phenylalanyl-tRNA synthetase alpha chain